MRLTRITAVWQRGCVGRSSAIALLAFSLIACSHQPPQKVAGLARISLDQPANRVVDFQPINCEQIWSCHDDVAMDNPLYWQRAIDCAVHLSPAEAHAEAKGWSDDNWQNAFKRAILLNNGHITPIERRQYLQRLDSYADVYPAAIRPLLILWREGQGALLQLSAERTRYVSLQQSSDAQLDALRQQRTELEKNLAATRRKLDRLTDIERQLSSRRSPYAPESSGQDSSAVDNISPDEANP